jgi:hypothetical protein
VLHTNRIHCTPTRVETPAELALKLVDHNWTLCTAFRLGDDLLFLNDSTSEDGASEWAVVRGGRQIESITFGWCSYSQALDYITRLLAGTLGGDYGPITLRFHPATEPCHACA